MASILKEGYRENELEYCKNVIKVFFLSLCPKKTTTTITTSSEPSMILVPIFSKRIYIYYQPTTTSQQVTSRCLQKVLRCSSARVWLCSEPPGMTCWLDQPSYTSRMPSWIPVTGTSGWRCSFFTRDMEVSLFGYGIHVFIYTLKNWHVEPSKIWRFAWKMMFLFTWLNGVFRWTMLSFRGVRLNLKNIWDRWGL